MTGGLGRGLFEAQNFMGQSMSPLEVAAQQQALMNNPMNYTQFQPGAFLRIPRGESLSATAFRLQQDEYNRRLREGLPRSSLLSLHDSPKAADLSEWYVDEVAKPMTLRKELQAKTDHWLRDWRAAKRIN